MLLAALNRSLEAQKPSPAPTWTASFALYIAFQVFCIVAAAVGNVLVCIAVCTDKHLRKRSNSLYVSLAVADLLIALFVMTVTLVRTLQGTWVFPDFFCEIYLSMDVMCSTASILNICAIAFDRYMHVQDPFNYDTRMTRGVFALGILLIWLLSGLISFVPFHLGWHIPFPPPAARNASSLLPSLATPPDPDHVCMLDLNFTYAFVSSCISFFIPLIVTLALYGVLYRTAREHAAKIKSAERDCSFNGDAEHRHHSHWRHRRRIKADNKAQLTLGIIMGLFLACWLPFFIVNIASGACKCITESLFNAFTWLGYFNSCLNPAIYTVFNKDFRNAFRKIVCGWRKQRRDLSQSIGLTKTRSRAPHAYTSSLMRTPNDSDMSNEPGPSPRHQLSSTVRLEPL